MTYFKNIFFSILLFIPFCVVAQSESEFPSPAQPPRLVNDFAHVLSNEQITELENKLVGFDQTTSTQITIVTVTSIGNYEVAQYAVELANKWGIGRKGKDNGVLLIAAINERKVNISTGYGLEGALTDVQCGRIIRNEIVPEFKSGKYFGGFTKASDAIIAATKGEYQADEKEEDTDPRGIIIFIVLVIYIILTIIKKSGGGGGNYMSGRGGRHWGGGYFGGPFSGGGGNWGGGSSGGGGFGGFGGGSFGGGGSSGSW